MTEFMHEVVAQRERQSSSVFSEQYVPLYHRVFIPACYSHLVYNVPQVIRNVQAWWDSPTERLMRAVFSTLGCEHRWVFDISRSNNVQYKYYCMDCRSGQTQHIREDRQ
jgi:ribosomal protein L44E